MVKFIIPFFAFAISGVSNAQTHRDGTLRECNALGWNTCDRWSHCMWVGVERGEGECMNNCPVIGWPDNIGTTQDCLNLEGCDTAGYFSRSCDFAKIDCSSANDDDWQTTVKQCQALDGCKFNLTPGRNECIPDCSTANDDDWTTTWKQCMAIEGCIFNPIFGRNECIPDWNAESFASIATEAPKYKLPLKLLPHEDDPSNRGSLRGIK